MSWRVQTDHSLVSYQILKSLLLGKTYRVTYYFYLFIYLFLPFFRKEVLGQRVGHKSSQWDPLSLVVSPKVGAWGSPHSNVISPRSKPYNFRAEWVVRITEWGLFHLGVSRPCGSLDLTSSLAITSLVAQTVKRLPAMLDSIPGSERSPGEGNGNPLQHSCLENPHGRRSLVGCRLWGRTESSTTEAT